MFGDGVVLVRGNVVFVLVDAFATCSSCFSNVKCRCLWAEGAVYGIDAVVGIARSVLSDGIDLV